MAKKDIDYDAILRRFVEKERSRFAILEPFTVDGWTAATDGWKLCAIKAGVFKASYNTENVPNIAAIWPDEQLTEKRIISLDKLIHWPYENGEPP